MSELSGDNIDQQNNIPNHSNFVDEDKLLLICNKKSVDDSKCHKILNMTATTNTMKHTNNNATDLSKQNKHLVDPDLIEVQAQNKIPESEIKRGIKRDHLTQQLNNSISNTTIPEIKECVVKKPKIDYGYSDMDLSSDDESQKIIESYYISPSSIKLPQEKENDVCNPNNQSRELSYYQITSASKQLPEITTSSTPLKMNNESCLTYDCSKDPLNVDSEHLVINNVILSYQDPRIIHTPNNESTHSIYDKNCQSSELSYYQIPSVSKKLTEIMTSSTPLKINNESCLTYDCSKDLLNVDSENLAINNVIRSYQDPRIIHTPNDKSIRSIYDKNCQKDDLYLIPGYVNQSPDDKPELIDADAEEIFRKLGELLETTSEYEKNVTKSQNQLILNQNQKNLQQPSVEPNLSVPHNVEASSKSSMNVLCGNYGSKTTSNYVKNNSLGVQLGLSSNVNNALIINKTSNELMKTIKSKTEDLNKKKFKISDIVIKLLSPYYGNNMFKTKELFKFMAREMVHKLLESVIHPEERIIKLLIRNMFSDKQMIQVESEDQIVKLLRSIP